jgi:hypothetical protein
MTAIQERYSTARNATNLKMKTETNFATVDILTAVGMASHASREAIMLWEVTFQGKTSAKIACVEMLEMKLFSEMTKRGWKGKPRKIAEEMLSWALYGVCQPCGGRGLKTVLGTPMLSDEICEHCNGTGKLEIPRTPMHTWLHEYMGRLTSQAGGQVMRKLAIDMDL